MKKSLSIAFALLLAFSSMTGSLSAEIEFDPSHEDFVYFEAVPWDLPEDAIPMRVDKVHDGDSINLTEPDDDWYEQYRVIGIQAPEIQGYRDEECYGPESAEFAKALMPKGTIVWIQQDISDKDPNGRFLRHIFIEDEETGDFYLLSEVLVLGGFARARSYPPDDLYDDVLKDAQEIAQEDRLGMWDCKEWERFLDD